MESDSNLENLRSALSCVFEKLGAESLTEPDRVELVMRAEIVQDQIDAIQDAVGEEYVRTATLPEPSGDRLF
ncbi:Uncharacterised protein [Nocardia otitidiscaviarum]|uniref:Uncharacterized protein n=1 Tax=Nocardia otitidiscaviarum TaxID=1823 RepID=A0A378YET5_9NOCA|nr:hypothetical protein [Nocardia otitidiscaviarum]SUA75716.1 Uncharacterised protein [Nocardia otitidiscaviarum]